MSRRASVSGGADLRAALKKWLARSRASAGPAAVRAGLAVAEAAIRRRAPVGATHDLEHSIHSVGPVPTRNGVAGAVVVASDHAAAVEYGTHDQAAQPFVRPAVDEDGPRALDAMARVLGRTL